MSLTLEQQRALAIADARRKKAQQAQLPVLDTDEPLTDVDEWGKSTISDNVEEIVSDLKEVGSDLWAAAQVGVTVGTGAASGITVAATGAVAQLFGRDPEVVAQEVEYYSQKGTIMPWGEKGQELLGELAVPLIELEETSSDIAWKFSGGNPYVATIIKTSMLGAAELALPSKGSINAMKTGRQLRARAKEMKQLARDLGIDIKQSELAPGIVEFAKRMSPEQRAKHMPYLKEQMDLAAAAARKRRNQLYADARATRAFVDSESAVDLSARLRSDLEFRGYVISDKKMRNVRERLDDLANMKPDETGTRVNLKEWDDVRKKINKMRQKNNIVENSALDYMNKEMGKWLDAEFNRLALNQGSAISGEISGVTAWKNARAASRDWHKRFREDRVIRDLIDKDATAETMAQWIFGASAMGAKREAGAVVNRLKAVLGKDHEAVRGIRADFLYEVAAPLLHPDGPNFNTFIRNYELMIERNPTLVRALDLDAGDFKELHDFARLQKKLPYNEVKAREVIKEATQMVSRLTVGHEIAKAGVKVNIGRDVLNLMIGVDRITQKQMFYELAGLKYGDIMLPRAKPLAAQFIAGAALTEINDAQEQIQPSQ